MTVAVRDSVLWVRPDSQSALQVPLWATSNPVGSAIMAELAKTPTAVWLTGSSTGSSVADRLNLAAGRLVTFVAYNAPLRDLGSYSAGGAASETAYRAWVDAHAAWIQGRLCEIVLDPDALAMADRMTDPSKLAERIRCLNYAIDAYTAAGAAVLLDVGDSGWFPAGRRDEMADLAVEAGVARAAGIVSNVSHFRWTRDEDAFCTELLALIAERAEGTDALQYAIDVSRNGTGPVARLPGQAAEHSWCNPDPCGFGALPTSKRSVRYYPRCRGLRHVKHIGSDGERDGAPEAGRPYPTNAVRMYHRARPARAIVW